MEVEFFQHLVDLVGSSAKPVDPIECLTPSLHRQRRDLDDLAVSGKGVGDAGSDDETDVIELAQLIHDCINLLCVGLRQAENGFRIVENNDHLLRR